MATGSSFGEAAEKAARVSCKQKSWRVALVGAEGVGKTLIAQLWTDKAQDLNVQPTTGTQTYGIFIPNRNCTLTIRDVSGKNFEDENVLRDFVTGADAIVLVLDVLVDRSAAALDSWLPTIMSAKSAQAVLSVITNNDGIASKYMAKWMNPDSPLAMFMDKIPEETEVQSLYKKYELNDLVERAYGLRVNLVDELFEKFP